MPPFKSVRRVLRVPAAMARARMTSQTLTYPDEPGYGREQAVDAAKDKPGEYAVAQIA